MVGIRRLWKALPMPPKLQLAGARVATGRRTPSTAPSGPGAAAGSHRGRCSPAQGSGPRTTRTARPSREPQPAARTAREDLPRGGARPRTYATVPVVGGIESRGVAIGALPRDVQMRAAERELDGPSRHRRANRARWRASAIAVIPVLLDEGVAVRVRAEHDPLAAPPGQPRDQVPRPRPVDRPHHHPHGAPLRDQALEPIALGAAHEHRHPDVFRGEGRSTRGSAGRGRRRR